ncbi:Disease resistance RPP13-like protein 4 [Cardamine amara subsp. amara]|uniref:Disease resistance RPP13-like protein 4 n=1 Tax=Cardamine amara subsp. amara TaxID=228776 RepID=A0ABD1C954_CARAN
MEPHVHSAVVHLAATVDLFKLYSSEESSKESSEGSTKGSWRGNSEGSTKGSWRGNSEGSTKGSLRGNSEGSTKGSSRGNSEGSTKGSSRGNSEGMLTMKRSSRGKVCLVKGSSLEQEAKTSVMKPEGLETIFNSSERYPDFTFKWFRKMDSLRVLYLGRWEQTATRHIEVESTKSLKDIKYLKNLRLASFQGISRIEQLENYICQLSKLVILDLKACYNLERLPEDIFLLKRLIYLDVSECYMLDGMPKGIAELSNLEVLKGFVISQSDDESKCAVKNLEKLRKLSITVNKRSFKVEKLMESLRDLKKLGSLKIAWGALFPKEESKKNEMIKEQVEKEEDGRNEEANLEEGNKHDEVNAESLKSDKVVEGEKKKSPST